MKVWIVNPYDPLPGDLEQLGRYGQLCRQLATTGHDVTWWTSDFVHRFKRPLQTGPVQDAARGEGYEVVFIPTPAYERNVSFRRLWSHRVFANRLRTAVEHRDPPDVILASSPPLEAANEIAKYGRRRGIPVIVDVQDQWPDTFVRALPRVLRPLRRIVLGPWYGYERSAYRNAYAVCGVANGYVQRALDVGGAKADVGEFPLGADVQALRQAADRGAEKFEAHWRKQSGQIRFVYSGSLSRSYDCMTIVQAARQVRDVCDADVQFVITGRGELGDAIDAFIREHHLDNITRAGFLDPDEWAYLMSQADAGFNASTADSLIYLPNKIFAYTAFGLAVLNTITGQCGEIVEQNGCGLNYTAGDVEQCAQAVITLTTNESRRAAMQEASRRLGENEFDVRRIAKEFAEFVCQVGSRGVSGH